jgi:UDP-glucose:(heptosyl)LPS alpha-1,3-glucosyltransferase
MHIAFVRQRYTAFGGAERFLAQALRAAQGPDLEVTLITRCWEHAPDLRILRCDPFYAGRLWRDWGFGRCVRRLLARQAYDLVQSHERIAGCHIYRAGDGVHREWLRQRHRTLGWLGRVRLGLSLYHRYVLAAERRLFRSPGLRAVICNSRMVKEEVQAYFPVPAHRVRVIYNAVDTQAYHPSLRRHYHEVRGQWRIPEDAVLFLFVGSGYERKGLPLLLQVVSELPRQAYLLVVGKDSRRVDIVERAARLGLADRVRFAGAQANVQPFYGAADAFVLPTLYDPFPNTALEAMAAGLPVVTSRKSGAAEWVRDGVSGFVCDALDRPALLDSMRRLLDRRRAARMGANARAAVAPIDFRAMLSQWLALYRELLRAGESRA